MKQTHSVLVTGGTSGLGYHAALSIARSHPEYLIILASRTDRDKAADSINRILNRPGAAIFLPLDLSSPQQIHTFVTKTLSSLPASSSHGKKCPPIKLLLLNAGLQFPGQLTTMPGHPSTDPSYQNMEATFAVNHAGHALLFHLLILHNLLSSSSSSSQQQQQQQQDPCNVVVTASGTHDPAQNSGLPDAVYVSADQLAHPIRGTEPGQADYTNGRQRYATSKLANVLWTYAVSRHLNNDNTNTNTNSSGMDNTKNININAFDPGLMPGTGLAREAHPIVRFIWHVIFPRVIPLLRVAVHHNVHTAQESGEALADLAMGKVGAVGETLDGKYFEGRKEIKSSEDSYDKGKQEDLWGWTVGFVEGVLKAEGGGGMIREKVEGFSSL